VAAAVAGIGASDMINIHEEHDLARRIPSFLWWHFDGVGLA